MVMIEWCVVWSWVKRRDEKESIRTKSELQARLLAAFKALQGDPEKVQQFFREADNVYTVS